MNQHFGNFSLEQVMSETDSSKRKTKIICTLGPACWSVEQLCDLIDAGMNIARFNFSHGDHKGHGEVLGRLREAIKMKKKPVGVLLDTKGPEIRTGFFPEGVKSILLTKNSFVEITSDYSFLGHSTKFACSYPELASSVKVGGQILIADGSLVCEVVDILENGVKVKIMNDVKLGERKNMNLPGCPVKLPTVTKKDEEDIVGFGLKHDINFIALSFTRTGQDIETVRDLLGPKGSGIKIIAKIENQEGLNNYEDILEHTDGIMVARGDLGMEIAPSKVFVAQKWMIARCQDVGKPVVTATQMMESMIINPRPTRAEASDVANSVLDGTDCVMLSGETANGNFPVRAVQIMSQICTEAEICNDSETDFNNRIAVHKNVDLTSSMAIAAVSISFKQKIPCIIVFTLNGEIARQVAKFRPNAQIIAVSTEQGTIFGLCAERGVICLRVPSFQGTEKLIEYAIKEAKNNNFVKDEEKCIIIQGAEEMNPDDCEILKIVNV